MNKSVKKLFQFHQKHSRQIYDQFKRQLFIFDAKKEQLNAEQRYSETVQMIRSYQNEQLVASSSGYCRLWLDLLKVSSNVEEIFIYLLSLDLSNKQSKVYQMIFNFYVENKKYQNAFEILQIGKNKFPGEIQWENLEQILLLETQRGINLEFSAYHYKNFIHY